jgi:rhodanese-related sulfurtransferase
MRRLKAGEAVLVDVREPAEHARENIPGAILVPLSRFGAHDFSRVCTSDEAVIFHCQSGARTAMHGRRLAQCGIRDVFVLAGGIAAWKRAGLPTKAR